MPLANQLNGAYQVDYAYQFYFSHQWGKNTFDLHLNLTSAILMLHLCCL